jgi:LemA protein
MRAKCAYKATCAYKGGVDAMPSLLVVAVVLVVLLGLGVLAFNGLVRRRNRVQEAWSEIDVELKRRHDLIPNLVETVKGYAAHESKTFEAVTAARAGAVSAGATGDPAQVGPAENMLSQTLRSLFAVSENYPQLRAVETFLQLQEQLTATEDKLEYARRFYNTSGRDYNIALQSFPRNLLAGPFGFHAVAFFQTDEAERQVPEVNFTGGPPNGSAPNGATAPPARPVPTGSGPPTV